MREAAGNRLQNRRSHSSPGSTEPPSRRGRRLGSPWPARPAPLRSPRGVRGARGSGLTRSRGLTAQPPALLTRSRAGAPVGRGRGWCWGGRVGRGQHQPGDLGLSLLQGEDSPLEEKQALGGARFPEGVSPERLWPPSSVPGADLTLTGNSHCWARGLSLSCPEEASVLREFLTVFLIYKGRFKPTFLPRFPLRSAAEVCSFNDAPSAHPPPSPVRWAEWQPWAHRVMSCSFLSERGAG